MRVNGEDGEKEDLGAAKKPKVAKRKSTLILYVFLVLITCTLTILRATWELFMKRPSPLLTPRENAREGEGGGTRKCDCSALA